MENKNFSGNFLAAVIFTVIGLYLIKLLNISYPLTIVNTSRSSELAVVGEGKIEVSPDTAYVDAGISTDNKTTVSEAQNVIDTVNNKIVAALKDLKINKADIKTSNYSVYPNYKYDNNVNTISGYNGNATIEIKVRDTQLVPKVIEAATKSGANQIQGVRFTVDNPQSYREQARNAAIKNAKEQAQKIAKDLGISLGKITNIVESSDNGVSPKYDQMMPMAGGGAGGSGLPVIEQGSQTLSSTVTLYFEKR